jgi:hypothetical protein
MSDSVFVEGEFFLLIAFSIVLPIGTYVYMMRKRALSRATMVLLGSLLVGMSGVTVYLLQLLADMAKATTSMLDDRIFASQVALALYLVPLLFAGIGVNIISDVLIKHLNLAEARFERERAARTAGAPPPEDPARTPR